MTGYLLAGGGTAGHVNPLPEATAWYAESGSSGPGAAAKARVPWSRQLSRAETAPFATKTFLAGPDGWDPTKQKK